MHIEMPEFDSIIHMSSENGFAGLQQFLKPSKNYSQAVIISDWNVFPLYGQRVLEQLNLAGIKSVININIDPGETKKNLDTARVCWETMQNAGIDRHAVVISLGGGVISDLAGFVAACYMRGVDVIHIPTTLMGMVDASIGGKTALNLNDSKNLIGAVYHPKLVLISTDCLQSLPMQEFVGGLAEVVKYGIIQNPSLFETLENNVDAILSKENEILKNIITECATTKANIVHKDSKDHGLRNILNLGHTFAHAVEAATHYRLYSHGEAVSIGLSCAFYTSYLLNMIEESLIHRLHDLLMRFMLPIHLPDNLKPETILEYMYYDKKTHHGILHLILVKNIGHAEKTAIEPKIVIEALNLKMTKAHEVENTYRNFEVES